LHGCEVAMLGPADCFKIASSPSMLIHARPCSVYVHVPYEAYVPPQGARRPVLSYRVLASTGYWHYNLKRDAAHSMDAASDADRTDL
jgi:hypothetical protein